MMSPYALTLTLQNSNLAILAAAEAIAGECVEFGQSCNHLIAGSIQIVLPGVEQHQSTVQVANTGLEGRPESLYYSV
jgi:hypothetical protein